MNKRILTLLLFSVLWASGCTEPLEEQARLPSAQPNVIVLEQQFAMPGLDRQRTVRLYLPPDYGQQTDYYPVLYMHDGQNVFDDATSYAGEWRVDEALNELSASLGFNLIVVAIDNGADKRLNELSPWTNEKYGEAEGKAYLDFIVDVVKPYIDTHYRTKADVTHTGIIGSSMGGLFSHYAIVARPDVFSKAGIFSPAYWYAEDVYEYVRQHPLPHSAKIDLLVGEKEGTEMVKGLQKMVELIAEQKHPSRHFRSKVVAGKNHNEGFWASEFSQSVLWLYAK